MMDIIVQKMSPEQLKKMGVFNWPIWEKEESRFAWKYSSIEQCYLIEGEAIVETKEGQKVAFGKGDFVSFPKGLSCTWDIRKAVKKHYNFK